MSFDPVRATLISDFNLEVFSGYLKNDPQFPIVSPFVTPFGQVMQVLMDENMKCWEQFNDLAVVWTRPEGVINSFQKALDFRPVNFEKALEEVDAFYNNDDLSKIKESIELVREDQYLECVYGTISRLENKVWA